MNFSGSGRAFRFRGRFRGSYNSANPPNSTGSSKDSKLLLISSVRIPRLRFLKITPGFYPGIARPIKSILIPQFLLIIPGFYSGSATGYYFQGLARPERLLPYSDLPFSVSSNTAALQFANRFPNKCGGGSCHPRPAFRLIWQRSNSLANSH